MKSKWYRNSFFKVLFIVVFHAAVVLAAVSAVFILAMGSQGIYLWSDMGESYIHSQSLSDSMYYSSHAILDGIEALAKYPSDEEDTASKLVDMREVYEGGELTYTNTSGLAYSLEDLNQWEEKGWYMDYCNSGEIIEACTEDGERYYYYKEDFLELIEDGKITFQWDDILEESELVMLRYVRELVRDGEFWSTDLPVAGLTDEERHVQYVDAYEYTDNIIEEKYPPANADNFLDAVNNSSFWRGRLSDAYEALNMELDSIREQKSVLKSLENYREGNTNLTYLFVDLDSRRVYTNKSEYKSYEDMEAALEEMKDSGAYAVIRPKLAECESNLNFSSIANLQDWQNSVENEISSGNYVFAIAVDQDFPVADYMAEANATYHKFIRGRFLAENLLWIGLGLLLAGAVSIVWLTAAAGRRQNDEEIHLNWFDHIFTEIAAAGTVLLWGLGLGAVLEGFSFGAWADYKAYLTVAAALGIYTASLFLIGYLSLVRRIKAKTLWKGSLLRRICLWIKKLIRRCGDFLEIFSRNTGSKIKLTLLVGGFLLLQFIINAMIFYGSAVFFIVLFLIDCAALAWCILKANGQERILNGLKQISGGELQYKIPLDHLTGEQKMMAEYVNHIGQGLDAAVESNLKSERMKTELITNVSHDIKTPLTSIINYVDLLKRENFTDPKICGYLEVLDEKAQRLKVLTEDVVEASKASSGSITLEVTELNLIELLHQVIGEFEEKFQEKNLTLMVHFPEDEVMICADGRRLWRVLENVFNNVVKYAMEGTRVYTEATPARGRVTFSLKNISAQPLNISADELTERFIRGDVSRNTEGSGLGLSIAKSLTELQGGEFTLYLDGDLFKVIITFPLATKTEKEE